VVFAYFKRRRERSARTMRLYERIVEEARRPFYFSDLGVPDTVDGRFDMLAAMVHLVLRRFRGSGQDDESQALFDLLFKDMDQTLREMGAGDMGVAPRVKNMAQAFYGRVKAYDEGLDTADRAVLVAALRRNLYRLAEVDDVRASAMADRLRAIDRHLAGQDPAAIANGDVAFPGIQRSPA